MVAAMVAALDTTRLAQAVAIIVAVAATVEAKLIMLVLTARAMAILPVLVMMPVMNFIGRGIRMPRPVVILVPTATSQNPTIITPSPTPADKKNIIIKNSIAHPKKPTWNAPSIGIWSSKPPLPQSTPMLLLH